MHFNRYLYIADCFWNSPKHLQTPQDSWLIKGLEVNTLLCTSLRQRQLLPLHPAAQDGGVPAHRLQRELHVPAADCPDPPQRPGESMQPLPLTSTYITCGTELVLTETNNKKCFSRSTCKTGFS